MDRSRRSPDRDESTLAAPSGAAPERSVAAGRWIAIGVAVGATVGVLGLLGACASSTSGSAGSSSPVTAALPVTAPAGNVVCDYVPDGQAAKAVDAPSAIEPNTGTATAKIELTGAASGPVTIDLDRAIAPCTVGSFAHLAQSGYFDGSPCHRLTASTTLHVLQCGDPSGTGRGGPGYAFADETDPGMTYPAGTLAMANAGPDTNGSQFFLVYQDSVLPPDYTVFGTVTDGLDFVTGIAAQGTTSGVDGEPVRPVTISSVTVS
jgi:peptidyl-prolyl cis-trans isomerase B (cyclophilin B)